MKLRSTNVVGLILLTSLSASGQAINMMSSSFRSGPDGVMQGQATFRVPPNPQPPVLNAPYSGELVSESKQTLIDGTNITRQMPRGSKTWRDSQGRVRTEENRMGGGLVDSNGAPAFVQISDPVAGCDYVLDNMNRVAHRVQFSANPERSAAMARRADPVPAVTSAGGSTGWIMSGIGGGGGGGVGLASGGGGGGGAAMGRASRQRPEVTTEDLGSQTIDGVLVYGTRRTTIIPEGAQGNDRPMKSTNESWRSKDLQLTLLTVDYSPLNGTTTTKFANFSTSEPDPSLFMVPSGYSIMDEKERSFTIKVGEQ